MQFIANMKQNDSTRSAAVNDYIFYFIKIAVCAKLLRNKKLLRKLHLIGYVSRGELCMNYI